MFSASDTPPGKEYSERDQNQPEDEDNRDQKEDDDADIGIARVPSKLDWEDEQPREAGGSHQGDAQHAHPMTGEQHG